LSIKIKITDKNLTAGVTPPGGGEKSTRGKII